MKNKLYSYIKEKCKTGFSSDVDEVMKLLNQDIDIPTTKIIDFYIGTITNKEGLKRIEYYLFNGTQIQRNYCTLFYLRKNELDIVWKAYKLGLIDEIQAFSR